MTHGSLFSGIGGFDLASEWMGWENVFHCEWNEFGKKVLNYYWPNAISYDDITKTDFTIHRGTIDILTGGFPCQPYSMAGKRLGKDDERHLWPEMLRAIREIKPRWVVGENVSGLISWNGGMVFDEVQADLEAEGYEVRAFILPACGVNAPHRRDRVWFVAHDCSEPIKQNIEREQSKRIGNRTKVRGFDSANGEPRTFTHPGLLRPEIGQLSTMGTEQLCEESDVADTCYLRLQGSELDRSVTGQREIQGESRQPFRPVCDQWSQFPTQPPVRGRNDGLSHELVGITVSKHRNESIKAYGNAIVPQVVYQIFKAIEQNDHNRSNRNPHPPSGMEERSRHKTNRPN
jgi:DNA (cytosine-5)-methyltransferase 1